MPRKIMLLANSRKPNRFNAFSRLALAGITIVSSWNCHAEISANVAYVTDYIDNGVSNSNRDPALQGGIDYYLDSGLYLGTWLSTVDFDDGDEAEQEWDVYAGYSWQWKESEWDVGLTRYIYPGADSQLGYDTNEAYISAGIPFAQGTATLGYSYSPDYFSSGDSHYLEAKMDIDLPYENNLTLHLGHQAIKDNSNYGLPDYSDWLIGVSREWAGLDIQLAVQGTDIDQSECYGGLDWCDTQVTLSVGYTFQLSD